MQEAGVTGYHPNGINPTITLRSFEKVSNPKSIHGIYPYRGKMSAFDAAHVISQLRTTDTILDPFCGTGTIVYEAQARGMRAIGVDNNPIACTIARGKTQQVHVNATLNHLESAVESAQRSRSYPSMPSESACYFHPDTADQIMRMLYVSEDFSAYERSVFYGSICVAARACNGWIWTSTSVGKLNPPLRQVDFYKILMRKARKHIIFVRGHPQATIHQHDAKRIYDIVPENSIDVVYCSPPYFDALDYTGYYTKIVLGVLEVDRGLIRDGLIQRYSTYRADMATALKAIDRVVKKDAIIIFVVGDRMVRRELIRGSEFFAEIAPWSESYTVERSYTNTPSQIWDKINKTQRKEQVIVWDLGRSR
ncbi:MAG: DNA methyltransferase [Candidatus Thorarchaeota archaeon]|jgi:16S rRNA G966 N2-methylase RsmD